MRYWKLLVGILSVCAVIFLVLLVKNLSSKPAIGKINPIPAPLNQTETDNNNVFTLDTNYYVLRHNGNYELQPQSAQSAGSLDIRTLIRPTTDNKPAIQVGISIITMPDGGLKNSTTYRFYEARPTLYELSTTIVYAQKYDVATKKGQELEKTAFVAHGSKLMLFTMSSSQTSTQADNDFSKFLSEIQWK